MAFTVITILILAIFNGQVIGFKKTCQGWRCQSNIMSNRFNSYTNSYTSYFPSNKKGANTTPSKQNKTVIIPAPPARVRVNKTLTSEFRIPSSLDLYYLMDGTGTFADDRQSLGTAFPKFVSDVNAIDSNTQIGFGLFTDKGDIDGYGLDNINSLPDSTIGLGDTIYNTRTVGGGSDYQEDPLTAIHQIAKCTDKIGWGADSLRMLVVTTDEDYKTPENNRRAFDPTKCHLNTKKFNGDAYRKVDFPSVSQVNQAITEASIQIIFAIRADDDSKIFKRYEGLKTQITPSPLVVVLEDNSANIIDVIASSYKIATATATIQTRITGTDYKELYVTTKCGDQGTASASFNVISKDICVVSDNHVQFQLTVSLLCPRQATDTAKVEVNIEGQKTWKNIDLNQVC